jgi:hypothetical protein
VLIALPSWHLLDNRHDIAGRRALFVLGRTVCSANFGVGFCRLYTTINLILGRPRDSPVYFADGFSGTIKQAQCNL